VNFCVFLDVPSLLIFPPFTLAVTSFIVSLSLRFPFAPVTFADPLVQGDFNVGEMSPYEIPCFLWSDGPVLAGVSLDFDVCPFFATLGLGRVSLSLSLHRYGFTPHAPPA